MKGEGGSGRRRWGCDGIAGTRWLASKKWVRMEDSGRVDDEGRPILERVDLMEAFFGASTVRSRELVIRASGVRFGEAGGGSCM